MREIKFRGKRLGNGEWVYGWLYSFVPYGDHHERGFMIKEDMGDDYEVNPETVGQYTGIHEDDDNQDEIYNGDVVELEYEGEKHVCQVKYEGCGFMFVADSLPDGFIWASEVIEFDRSYCWAEGTTKLGNVHDNPELLEGRR